jgi:hypothetical protein
MITVDAKGASMKEVHSAIRDSFRMVDLPYDLTPKSIVEKLEAVEASGTLDENGAAALKQARLYIMWHYLQQPEETEPNSITFSINNTVSGDRVYVHDVAGKQYEIKLPVDAPLNGVLKIRHDF